MEDIKYLIKEKIKSCLSGITNASNSASNVNEAEAVEHLSMAYSYLNQINESEGKKDE